MTGVRYTDNSDAAEASARATNEAATPPAGRPVTISGELAEEILATLRQARGHKLPYSLLERMGRIGSALIKARKQPAPGQGPQP